MEKIFMSTPDVDIKSNINSIQDLDGLTIPVTFKISKLGPSKIDIEV